MAGMGPSSSGSGGAAPKILLAKPTTARAEGVASGSSGSAGIKLMRDRDDDSAARARLPHGSLNLLSDSWEFTPDRFLPLVAADNSEFMVVGVLGAPGAGKSTILNEIYGFDANTQGVLPPFHTQTAEMRAMARHCSVGIELRMCAERIILLDTQPVFSASVLADLMRPDGSSAIPVLGSESMSAELAHELMGLQLGVFLFSVCHVVLLVTEGNNDISMWRLMQTIEMLKQGIPDPSCIGTSGSQAQSTSALTSSGDKENDDSSQDEQPEHFADAVFVHSKLRQPDLTYTEIRRLEMALNRYFPNPAFKKTCVIRYKVPQFPPPSEWKNMKGPWKNLGVLGMEKGTPRGEEGVTSLAGTSTSANKDESGRVPSGVLDKVDIGVNFYVLPMKVSDDATLMSYESYYVMLQRLRNQVLALQRRSFGKPISERDWLKSAARIWDLVKKSPVLADYCKMLQGSGLYRR